MKERSSRSSAHRKKVKRMNNHVASFPRFILVVRFYALINRIFLSGERSEKRDREKQSNKHNFFHTFHFLSSSSLKKGELGKNSFETKWSASRLPRTTLPLLLLLLLRIVIVILTIIAAVVEWEEVYTERRRTEAKDDIINNRERRARCAVRHHRIRMGIIILITLIATTITPPTTTHHHRERLRRRPRHSAAA